MKAVWISLVLLFTFESCSPLPSDRQLQNNVTQLPGASSPENPGSPINTPDFSQMTLPVTDANQFVRLAEEDLADRLKIGTDQIRFLKISEIDWQDITLGCAPAPGQTLQKGKLSGYRIWLEANGKNYAYHVGLDGRIFLCPEEYP